MESDIVIIGTADDDLIIGNNNDNIIQGLEGDDRLRGGLGDDLLDGGSGADVMEGGRGSDTYVVDDIYDRVIEHFPAHTPHQADEIDTVLTTLPAFTLLRNVENLEATAFDDFAGVGNALDNHIRGNAGNDRLNGRDGDDHLEGEGGDDVLFGGRGDAKGITDVLDGGDGNDKLVGWTGADTTIGGRGNDIHFVDCELDTVFEAAGAGRDVVASLSNFTLASGVEVETLVARAAIGADAINLAGNEFTNRIMGREGADILDGRGGSDSLFGRGGDDWMAGGDGDDILRGQAGDDLIFGGAGNDVMNGGLGADTFVAEAGFGQDKIFRFHAAAAGGDDRIDLSGLGIAEEDFASAVQIDQRGGNVSVSIGSDTILLISMDASTIDATSFMFA